MVARVHFSIHVYPDLTWWILPPSAHCFSVLGHHHIAPPVSLRMFFVLFDDSPVEVLIAISLSHSRSVSHICVLRSLDTFDARLQELLHPHNHQTNFFLHSFFYIDCGSVAHFTTHVPGHNPPSSSLDWPLPFNTRLLYSRLRHHPFCDS